MLAIGGLTRVLFRRTIRLGVGELELIRARERGLTPHQRRNAIKRRDSGGETLAEIGCMPERWRGGDIEVRPGQVATSGGIEQARRSEHPGPIRLQGPTHHQRRARRIF